MVIHRVLHEVSYFSGCSNSRTQQKELVEDFISEALYQARTSLGQGNPPTSYKDTKLIAEDIVSNKTAVAASSAGRAVSMGLNGS